MKGNAAIVVGLLTACAKVAIAADAPYVGVWKMNAGKSQLTGETLSIETKASGVMHYDVGGFAYDFNLDGKEYPLPDGGTTSWTAIDGKTWQVTNRRNGKVSATYRLVLDGDTMIFQSALSKADGGTLDESGKATRVSGGPGFVGRWRISAVKAAITTMVIAPNGADGVTLTYSDEGAVCKARFDGRDYPVTGPFVGKGRTSVVRKTGPRSFEITQKLNGKPLYLDDISVAEDGRTLTLHGTPAGSREPVTVVYDRQQ